MSLWIALPVCAWSVALSFAGGWLQRADLATSGARGLYLGAVSIALAALGLWTALATGDVSLRYVATFTSLELPVVYRLAAFWAGGAGSMLFASLALVGCAALATWKGRATHGPLMPWVTGTTAAIVLVVVAATVLTTDPFARLEWIPTDGRGLDPLLQHPAMALHPPVLHLGYAATAIPFAFVVAALVTGRLDVVWRGTVRNWTLIGWVVLTIAIVLGIWWAYDAEGGAGSWQWDPVRNRSLWPWLTSSTLLHLTLAEEQHGWLRRVSVGLVIATFLLAGVGSAVALGGATRSAPTFGVGGWLVWSLAVALVTSVALVALRWQSLGLHPDAEGVPAPRRRPLGAHFAHAGAVILLAALAGTAVREEHEVTLADGGRLETTDPYGRAWTFTSDGMSRYATVGREVVAIALVPAREGRVFPVLTSELREHFDSHGHLAFPPTTGVGTSTTILQDVTLALERTIGDRAVVRVAFNPLAAWVWVGGGLMAIGGLLALSGRVAR
ncbi:MAG: cytochrome c biogenesis protein CcsA [Gemmatimonadaceae bacterium]